MATRTSAPVGSAERTDRPTLAHQFASTGSPAAPEDDRVPFVDDPPPCPFCGKETIPSEDVSGRHGVGGILCRNRFDHGEPAPLGAAA